MAISYEGSACRVQNKLDEEWRGISLRYQAVKFEQWIDVRENGAPISLSVCGVGLTGSTKSMSPYGSL